MEQDTVQLLDKWGSKLQEVLHVYGPDAVALGLNIGRIGAIQTILVGVLLLVTSIIFAFLCKKCINLSFKSYEDYNKEFFYQTFVLINGIISLVTLAKSLESLLNIYAWVGMFHPEFYLAAKAIGLI